MTGLLDPEQIGPQYHDILEPLFEMKGIEAFEFVCTLLQVGTDESVGWDPLQESREFVTDLSALSGMELPKKRLAHAGRTRVRLALLYYAHLMEMAAPYHTIANLLRVRAGMPYVDDPFFHLIPRRPDGKERRRERRMGSAIATHQKIDEIKRMAEVAGHPRVGRAFDAFYQPDLLRAVHESGFVLRGGELLMPRGPRAKSGDDDGDNAMPAEWLAEIFTRAYAYFHAFMKLETRARKEYAKLRGKCVPYEIELKALLELLFDDQEVLRGFKVHWPNKSESVFRRTGARCELQNVKIDSDGSVNLYMGEYYREHHPMTPLVPQGGQLEYTPAEGSSQPPRWPKGLGEKP